MIKAITSGFDKMDEVKRWDLSQLPGLEGTLEAIEEPEKTSGDIKIIKLLNKRIDEKYDSMDKLIDLANKAKEEGNSELNEFYFKSFRRK